MRPTGAARPARGAPVEGEGAEGRARPRRPRAPPSGAIAVIEVTTLARSLVARATVAPARRKSVTVCVAEARPAGPVADACPDTTGTVVTSPVRPVARDGLEDAEEVEPEELGRLVGTGTEDASPSSPGRTGNAQTSAPPIWCGSAGLRANSGGETWGGSWRGARPRSADDVLEGVPEGARLVGVELDHQPATALERDAHDDAAAFLGDLERSVARPAASWRPSAQPSS